MKSKITDFNSTLYKEFLKFCLVGAIGFAVEALIIYCGDRFFAFNLIAVRFISFPVALLTTWILNRIATFKSRQNKLLEFLKYAATQTSGIVINIACYSICIFVWDFFGRYPVMALAVGSGVALFFNFLVSRLWVFARH